jgi:hypothetical protein
VPKAFVKKKQAFHGLPFTLVEAQLRFQKYHEDVHAVNVQVCFITHLVGQHSK